MKMDYDIWTKDNKQNPKYTWYGIECSVCML